MQGGQNYAIGQMHDAQSRLWHSPKLLEEHIQLTDSLEAQEVCVYCRDSENPGTYKVAGNVFQIAAIVFFAKGASGRKGSSTTKRVRHHTSPEALASISETGTINPSRGGGVHVEVEPFGPAKTASRETGAFGRGAYVEFDSPATVVSTNVGPRNTGVIPTSAPLRLESANPSFVKRPWWKFWGD